MVMTTTHNDEVAANRDRDLRKSTTFIDGTAKSRETSRAITEFVPKHFRFDVAYLLCFYLSHFLNYSQT